jgi:pyruvate,orthophosphate dikinase
MSDVVESVPGSGPASSVEAASDESAELCQVIAAIQEAADVGSLGPLMGRLLSLLENQFAREEAGGGILVIADEASPRHRVNAAQLRDEHGEILSALRGLLLRFQGEGVQDHAAVEGEVAAVLTCLREHDARESELLGEEPAPATAAESAPSNALEVNLRRTAVDVVIPEEHRVLLDITADRYGIHESTQKLLHEINHRYIGWAQTLEDLHRRATGDLAYCLGHERAPEAIGVFCALYAKAVEQATPAPLRETAVRNYLYYLEKVARESRDARQPILPALEPALARLGVMLRGAPHLAVTASPRLKRLAAEIRDAAPDTGAAVLRRSLVILADALREVYTHWLFGEDPADWWRDQKRPGADAPLPEEVDAISHARLGRRLASLERIAADEPSLASHADALLALPDDAQIERGYLAAAACFESPENDLSQNQLERIRWLVRVLSVEALSSVHEQALSEINHSYLDVLRGGDGSNLERFVRETFAILRRTALSRSPTALNLIEKVGLEVLSTGATAWAEVVIDEILEWDFPSPDFSGFTEEWQVRVNPAHLRAIRAYLAMIEGNPELARTLIAALVVHLKMGGIFIADTDLFQRDVSELLQSNVDPVYHQVKHLLKLFPVYFNDIGAEGELRDVSSRIDELTRRKDPLCHFLRKQCHVESNPQLVRFSEAIAQFWATGECDPLRPYVPASLYDRLDIREPECAGMHRIFAQLAGSEDVRTLFELEPAEIERRLAEISGTDVDREKAALLFRLRQLIGAKYEFAHDDLIERLRGARRFEPDRIELLSRALSENRHESALEILIEMLEELKAIIVGREATQAIEDIYRKRHIAVGIPSLYGRYQEEKFEAAGLTFRIESLANVLFERMISEQDVEYITRSTLQRAVRWLWLMLRALRVDGCRARGIATGVAMLEQALDTEGISVDQYINIFQVMSRGVDQLIRIRFLDGYEPVLNRLVGRMLTRGVLPGVAESDPRAAMLEVSEKFLRDLIAGSFGLQQLDNLVGKILRTLTRARESLDRDTLSLLMTYDADRCCVPIDREKGPLDGAVYLGNKGHLIKQLARGGLPVPDGFILTTEVFRCRKAIWANDDLRRDVNNEVRRQVARLERLSGRRYGDPRDPLLLSVRSGASISMPGMLDTFLNVGMNAQMAEGLAVQSGSAWGAWDAYRRFLQFWGMGHGLPRDLFDALMREAKAELGVEKKAQFSDDDMRELAFRYRSLLLDRNVEVIEDGYEQLAACVELVLRSWDSTKASVYRSELRIAEEWGTAVIVQNMVYGNLSACSGTGVVLTCNPRRTAGSVQLYGDFVAQGQGDDVVSGLVDTFPITEEQRRSEPTSATVSLEKDFPRIYEEMLNHARTLIDERGMFHQEIEFTFEGEDPQDLYILQTRDAVLSQASSLLTFVPGAELERAKLATGIGAGGGALSGRIAHCADEITELRRLHPDDPIILVRPDTVPDDIPLILQADGMVTARGGATSHAAVAAHRIGRTCVVGCRQLEVDEARGCSRLAEEEIRVGEFISIDGHDGSIYLGKHRSKMVRQQRLV